MPRVAGASQDSTIAGPGQSESNGRLILPDSDFASVVFPDPGGPFTITAQRTGGSCRTRPNESSNVAYVRVAAARVPGRVERSVAAVSLDGHGPATSCQVHAYQTMNAVAAISMVLKNT